MVLIAERITFTSIYQSVGRFFRDSLGAGLKHRLIKAKNSTTNIQKADSKRGPETIRVSTGWRCWRGVRSQARSGVFLLERPIICRSSEELILRTSYLFYPGTVKEEKPSPEQPRKFIHGNITIQVSRCSGVHQILHLMSQAVDLRERVSCPVNFTY